ncbi:hypothetical protein AB0E01_18065, partial [Nocardia vinacea]
PVKPRTRQETISYTPPSWASRAPTPDTYKLREKTMVALDNTAGRVLLSEFRRWLLEQDLSAETVRCYCKQAGIFLDQLPDSSEQAVWQLDSGQVTSFMVGYCRDRNTVYARVDDTALRVLARPWPTTGAQS